MPMLRLLLSGIAAAMLSACSPVETPRLVTDIPDEPLISYQLAPSSGEISSAPFTFTQSRGKWLIVTYWASWCDSCVKEISVFNALARQYPEHLRIVAVNVEGLEEAAIPDLIRRYGIRYAHLNADPRRALGVAPVQGVPTSWIVQPDGTLSASPLLGAYSAAELEKILKIPTTPASK